VVQDRRRRTVKIPADIAPGEYVLRHEIIALHAAGQADGAQDYPQCVNLDIKGSGTAKPAGVAMVGLYTPTDPGILFNLYGTFTSYSIPGPAVYGS
jgi:cellulase